MNIRDAQAFIPGWNIVYMLREYARFEKEAAGQEVALEEARLEGEQDLLQADAYREERDAAKACGDFQRARKFDEKIARLAISHVNRIA